MAKEVGLDWYYDFIYWFGSNQSHSNVRSAGEYMGISPGGEVIYKLGPTDRGLLPELGTTCDFSIRGLERILTKFGVPAQPTVEELRLATARTFGSGETPLT